MVLLNTAHIKFKLRKTLHLSLTWQDLAIPAPPYFQPSTYCLLERACSKCITLDTPLAAEASMEMGLNI